MIEGHAVDSHEVLQIVLVRRVVPVPGHHIERGAILRTKHRMKQTKRLYPTDKHKSPLNWSFHREKGMMNNVFLFLNSQIVILVFLFFFTFDCRIRCASSILSFLSSTLFFVKWGSRYYGVIGFTIKLSKTLSILKLAAAQLWGREQP